MNYESYLNNKTDGEILSKLKLFTWYKDKFNIEKSMKYFDHASVTENYRILESVQRIIVPDDKQLYHDELKQMILHDEFELGKVTQSEVYFSQIITKSKDMALMIINQIYHDAIVSKDKHTVVGVLFILANMPYEQVSPVGPTIAAAAITTDDREIVRFAIMSFEYWNNPIALQYFDSIKIQSKWIDKYKNKVISKLSEVV